MIKNEDDFKSEDNLKNEDDLKKMICPPPHLRKYYLKCFDDLSPQQPQDY